MNKNSTNNNLTKSRLQWACRRGMLELDLLLTTFLEGAYPELSEEDKILFIVLLECEDPDVFAWLMGQKDPEDKSLQLIVDKIRAHVRKPV